MDLKQGINTRTRLRHGSDELAGGGREGQAQRKLEMSVCKGKQLQRNCSVLQRVAARMKTAQCSIAKRADGISLAQHSRQRSGLNGAMKIGVGQA